MNILLYETRINVSPASTQDLLTISMVQQQGAQRTGLVDICSCLCINSTNFQVEIIPNTSSIYFTRIFSCFLKNIYRYEAKPLLKEELLNF